MKQRVFVISLCLLASLGRFVFAQSGGEIAYGETVTGSITDEAPVHSWTFEGATGDTITISMNAVDVSDGGLDSYLILLDSAGEPLTENDDAAATTINAAIENFALPAAGTYTIQATRFGAETGIAVGDYELTLTLVAGAADETEAPPTMSEAATPITLGEPVTGSLNRDNFEDLWSFSATEGDVINLTMERTGGDLDTFIRVLDEDQRELGRNDDNPDSLKSELVGFILPYTGTYTVVATRYGFESGTSSGDYELVITAVEPEPAATEEPIEVATPEPETAPDAAPTESAPTGTVDDGQFGYGEFITGSLASPEATLEFAFSGNAGDVVTVSVKRSDSDLDPHVTLVDEAGTVIAENTSFNGAADARIVETILPQGGLYLIRVGAEYGTQGGFVVHLFADEATSTAPMIVVPTIEGDLVISLAWVGAADFDLAVVDPDGNRLDFATAESASGGTFAGDANGGCEELQPSPSESVYWENPAPSGAYQVEVAFIFPCGGTGAVRYSVNVQHQGAVIQTFDAEMTEGGLEIYEFTLD